MGFLDKIRQRKKEFVSQKFEENLGTTLNEEKRDMIRGVVDLSETSVKEVMIPRIDVDFLSVDDLVCYFKVGRKSRDVYVVAPDVQCDVNHGFHARELSRLCRHDVFWT